MLILGYNIDNKHQEMIRKSFTFNTTPDKNKFPNPPPSKFPLSPQHLPPSTQKSSLKKSEVAADHSKVGDVSAKIRGLE